MTLAYDGGQLAAAAGANPHSSQGSPAGVGPLSRRRRLSPRPSAAQAALLRRPPGRRLRGGPGSAPRAGSRGGPSGAAPQGRPLGGTEDLCAPRRAPRRVHPPLASPPLPSTPPLPRRHPSSFSSSPSAASPVQPLGAAGRTSRRRLLCVHV